jgi:transposase
MTEFSKHIGLDVHKERISVAVADKGRRPPRYWGEIENRPEAVKRLLKRLRVEGGRLRFCYEAGPCGYGLYRQLVAAGQDCAVVAPALIPRKPGERIKTNRRDSLSLARLDRAGELTEVWVPDAAQEALRDLSRAREDMKILDKQLRQRLKGFLLRHGRRYSGRGRWTQAYWRWLETLRFEAPPQQIVLEEYVAAVRAAMARTAGLEQQLQEASESWSLSAAARAAMALRGVDRTAAVSLLAELDDLSRFENPRQLMGYVGLVPSEHSSGDKAAPRGRDQGGQRARPQDAGGVRLGVSFSGAQNRLHPTPRRAGFAGGSSDRLGGPEAPLRTLSSTASARPQRAQNGDGDRARAVRISLGGRLRGAAAGDVSDAGLSRRRKPQEGRRAGRPARRTLEAARKRPGRAIFDPRVRQLHDETSQAATNPRISV